ncbi:rhodanese-like domain-containing protein [Roseimicrobium sp. ORNL1]|uniref:rhodanese-like domain-containing protein n=1 Tax=Roseimicrobium sp. ORNL1 TaxID=2711231 RepID=UPI0013E1B058|nr:rhodanese-like domain-containing protein [Roseimicrobium sp. ORNL1]QIF04344.1 rhodanese-like domain-containing protein [Roseimicrobium sp. ORNL1]
MSQKLTSLIISTLMLCGAVLGEDKKSPDGATHVKAAEAEKLVKEHKVQVLDVRTADEYKEGHIKGAKNIDFTENDFESEAAKLDKTKPVLVHCQGGGRSTKSLEVLEKLGFQHIYHLDGGLKGWQAEGKPVEK